MVKNRWLLSVLAVLCAFSSLAAERPHILFIAADDLRPELGCYGSAIAKTPHLDALAADGLLFNRAYCQQAICSPSRASLMTGARPDTIGVVENTAYFRELNPDIVTLPQHFIANGYEAAFCGKIYHSQKMSDQEKSWSRKPAWKKLPFKPKRLIGGYATEENQKIWQSERERLVAKYGEDNLNGLVHGPAFEKADVPDHVYPDGLSTELALATLNDHLATKPDVPLFLALGFRKPHLDFSAPAKYWDMYDPADIELAQNASAPEGGAAMGVHASFELRTRYGIPKTGDIPPELARTLLHAYFACASYIDAQVGKMLAGLEEAGIRDNTIIVFWGDHGWHLGDMGIWGKATNYEIAARVPLIAWTPDMPAKVRGKKTDALVELVDLYPTFCELADIELPDHLEGSSFAPLLDDLERKWKRAAFSQYPNPALREWAANPLSPGMRETFFGPLIEAVEKRIIDQQGEAWDRGMFENDLMGYTMRTDRHRLVVWKNLKQPEADPVFVELFDHKTDPNETKNIAAAQPKKVARLLKQFDRGWKGARPSASK